MFLDPIWPLCSTQASGNLSARLDIIGAKYVKESAVDIVSLFHQEFVMVKQSILAKSRRRASLAVSKHADCSLMRIVALTSANLFCVSFFHLSMPTEVPERGRDSPSSRATT